MNSQGRKFSFSLPEKPPSQLQHLLDQMRKTTSRTPLCSLELDSRHQELSITTDFYRPILVHISRPNWKSMGRSGRGTWERKGHSAQTSISSEETYSVALIGIPAGFPLRVIYWSFCRRKNCRRRRWFRVKFYNPSYRGEGRRYGGGKDHLEGKCSIAPRECFCAPVFGEPNFHQFGEGDGESVPCSTVLMDWVSYRVFSIFFSPEVGKRKEISWRGISFFFFFLFGCISNSMI